MHVRDMAPHHPNESVEGNGRKGRFRIPCLALQKPDNSIAPNRRTFFLLDQMAPVRNSKIAKCREPHDGIGVVLSEQTDHPVLIVGRQSASHEDLVDCVNDLHSRDTPFIPLRMFIPKASVQFLLFRGEERNTM